MCGSSSAPAFFAACANSTNQYLVFGSVFGMICIQDSDEKECSVTFGTGACDNVVQQGGGETARRGCHLREVRSWKLWRDQCASFFFRR